MQYRPNDALALERIAETYAGIGKTAKANQTYYRLFHEAKWQSVGGTPTVYLGYALVLAKTGQAAEAVKFYHEGAARLNFVDGKQNLKMLLPTFGDADDQVVYSPQRLQAMAHVGMAVYSQDDAEQLSHLDAAIKLQPDMPQAYYYTGQVLWVKAGRSRDALAAYQKARHYAGLDMQLMIDGVIKENRLEKDAALEQRNEAERTAPAK